jgi:acetyl esterase/lipase
MNGMAWKTPAGVLILGASLLLAAPPATKPAAPKGYESQTAVLAAIQSGELKLINVFEPVPESVSVTPDVEYGKGGGESLKLDLYQPKRLEGKAPGLILIHGGAWKGGRRTDYRYYCVRLAERGYVVATISYRLVKTATFPAAVQDAKCAVRWLRANAEKYHVDPNRIGVMGGSAGGHLAMMVGYSPDVPELEGDGGNQGVSSRVQAVVNFYGPTDLTTPFARNNGVVSDFIGKPYAEAADQYRLASPLTHLTAGDPPTLILHGTIDNVVPIDQADALDKRLAELKVPHEYVRLEGWPHAMDLSEEVNRYCLWHIERFLDKYLKAPDKPPA